MARGFGARETSGNAFKGLLSGLSDERKKALSDSIFFTPEAARAARFAGYTGPKSKNSFAWFTPETEKEVSAKASEWASGKKELLGKIWDASRIVQTPGGPIRRLPSGFLDYPDKQTFIDRHTRFLGDYYKQRFQQPISNALGTVFATDNKGKERAFLSDASPEMEKAMADWNAMFEQGEKDIRQDALDWLKAKV